MSSVPPDTRQGYGRLLGEWLVTEITAVVDVWERLDALMEQGGDPRDMAREAAKWVVKFQERLADLDQKYEDLIEDLTALRGKLDVRQGRVETAVRDIQEKQIAISNQDNDLVLKEQEVEDALQHIQSSNNVLQAIISEYIIPSTRRLSSAADAQQELHTTEQLDKAIRGKVIAGERALKTSHNAIRLKDKEMARLRSRVAELEDLKEKEVNALEDENTALRNKISELEDSKSNEIAMMQGQTSKRKSQAFHNDRALGHPVGDAAESSGTSKSEGSQLASQSLILRGRVNARQHDTRTEPGSPGYLQGQGTPTPERLESHSEAMGTSPTHPSVQSKRPKLFHPASTEHEEEVDPNILHEREVDLTAETPPPEQPGRIVDRQYDFKFLGPRETEVDGNQYERGDLPGIALYMENFMKLNWEGRGQSMIHQNLDCCLQVRLISRGNCQWDYGNTHACAFCTRNGKPCVVMDENFGPVVLPLAWQFREGKKASDLGFWINTAQP